MYYSTVVRVVREGTEEPVAGAKVSLFDRDRFLKDDLLGEGDTNAQGEVRFDYNSEDFVDLDDRLTGVFPDLYVVVRAADGSEVVTTRAETVPNTPRKSITVTVPASATFGAVPPAEPEPAA